MGGPSIIALLLGQVVLTSLLLGIMIAVERVIPIGKFSLRSRLPGVVFTLVNTVAATVTIWALQAIWRRIGFQPLAELQVDRWLGWAGPLTIVLAPLLVLLSTDFFGYWFHRIQHTLLWPVHAVHHSVEDLHAASSYTHVSDAALKFVFMTIPMSVLPFVTATNMAIVGVLLTLSQFYIHSPVQLHLGPLRYLVTDNRYHRIHHSTDPQHFNRNFGTTFTIWDQLFRTAYFPKPGEWPETGLPEMPEPRTLRDYLLFPVTTFRRARPH